MIMDNLISTALNGFIIALIICTFFYQIKDRKLLYYLFYLPVSWMLYFVALIINIVFSLVSPKHKFKESRIELILDYLERPFYSCMICMSSLYSFAFIFIFKTAPLDLKHFILIALVTCGFVYLLSSLIGGMISLIQKSKYE